MVASYYGKTAIETMKSKKLEVKRECLPPKAPRDKPNIYDVTGDSLSLSWQPADLPANAVITPIYYVIERRCPPSKNWIEVASDLKECSYTMKDYRCDKDYMFRIRAGNDYGISDPSLSNTLFARPVDTSASLKKSDDKYKTKAKPRTVWDKPDICDLQEQSLVLKWKASSLPDYALQTPIWYIVEQRTPPNLEWLRLATDVKETEYQVTKLDRKKDYYFRIRPANEFGMAEPSMPAQLRKLEEVIQPDIDDSSRRRRSYSRESSVTNRGVPAHLRIPAEFLGHPDEKQYGVESRVAKIVTSLRGYPEPKITWFFMGREIPMVGGKHSSTLAPSGELTLEIRDFQWSDVGRYKVTIENEFGSGSQEVEMDMADPPTFLEPLKDQIFHLRQHGKLECHVHGIPYPKVTLKHDWRVIADSHRIKIIREDHDHWTLNIANAINMDEGMYECIAENVAGKVYCTATVKVTEKPGLYREIRFHNAHVEDFFHVIDEIGRGSYGVVRRGEIQSDH
jgi:hypothetical protein